MMGVAVASIPCAHNGCGRSGAIYRALEPGGPCTDGPYCYEHAFTGTPYDSPRTRARALARLCVMALFDSESRRELFGERQRL